MGTKTWCFGGEIVVICVVGVVVITGYLDRPKMRHICRIFFWEVPKWKCRGDGDIDRQVRDATSFHPSQICIIPAFAKLMMVSAGVSMGLLRKILC
jgi:hypothetical protein